MSTNKGLIVSTLAAVAATTTVLALRYSNNNNNKKTPSSSQKVFLLAGDIGGTNTRLAFYAANTNKSINGGDDGSGGGTQEALYSKEYLNSQYFTSSDKTFEHEIITPFLNECCHVLQLSSSNDDGGDDEDGDNHVEKDNNYVIVACFAVAGPVSKNSVTMTNLVNITSNEPMEITLNGTSIQNSTTGILSKIVKCAIINDFVGQGYGLLDLNHLEETIELTPGSYSKLMSEDGAPKACVGAGTGLGECYLTKSSHSPSCSYECYASEGGHVDFTPRSALEVELLDYLKKKFNAQHRVSVERVVSGKGLANVYEFLAKKFPRKKSNDVHDEFVKTDADMKGRVVGVNANKDKPDELCKMAMEIFASAYGSEVANCAVKFIPRGGLYVTGGLTPKNKKYIVGEDTAFMKAFWDKGRLSELLKDIPVFAVMVEDLGLRGARVCAETVSRFCSILFYIVFNTCEEDANNHKRYFLSFI